MLENVQPQSVDLALKDAAASSDTELSELAESLQEKATIDTYKGKIVRARQIKDGRQVSLFGFPDKATAEPVEQRWQREVTHRFFRVGVPLKEGKNSYRIYRTIKTHLDNQETSPIRIDGISRRSFIIALSKILSEYGYMPELTFKIGITKIKLTRATSITERQKGNFSMEIIPKLQYDIAYDGGLMKRLNNFTRPSWDRSESTHQERHDVFLKLIEDRLTNLIPFTHTDLNKYQNIRIDSDREEAYEDDERTKNNLHFLNGLIFLVTTVEVLVRLYRTEAGDIYTYPDLTRKNATKAMNSDAFPVAIAQSRSLLLLITGQISFSDFWGETIKRDYDHEQHRAYYGAVTGKGTIDYFSDIILEKLSAINSSYNSMISTRSAWKLFHDTYKQSNTAGYILEGRSRAYFDLKEVYGSGSESDEDPPNYSDSEDPVLCEVISFGR